MDKLIRKGAVGALLDEYEKSIDELLEILATMNDEHLIKIINPLTADENCVSIQSILSHVIHSGYGYACSIENRNSFTHERPAKKIYSTNDAYINALKELFLFTENIFTTITDDQLEELNQSLKIKTNWGQLYDIEQLMEHAIVHILRHRRQIENTIKTLK